MRKQYYPFEVLIWLLLTSMLASCSRDSGWSDAGEKESVRRGNQVIKAIEAYRADSGSLPSDLSLLVPKYLAEIPQPVVGRQKWRYLVRIGDKSDTNGEFFEIGVDADSPLEPHLFYNSSNKSWYKDTR